MLTLGTANQSTSRVVSDSTRSTIPTARGFDMRGITRARLLVAVTAMALAGVWLAAKEPATTQERRAAYAKAYTAGNFKDAYEGLRKLALDPASEPAKVGDDLDLAVTCLQRLGRVDEVDAFRESVVKAHPSNW